MARAAPLLLAWVVVLSVLSVGALKEADELLYGDSHDSGMYFTQKSTQMMHTIENWREMELTPGQAHITYEPAPGKPEFHVLVRSWEKLPSPPEPALRSAFRPPMWGRRAIIAFIRLSDPENPSYCFSMEASKRYVHHLSMAVKLETGNQADIDEANSLITPDCVPTNASCYASGSDCLVNRMPSVLSQMYGKLFDDRPFASRTFMAHDSCNHNGWVGLAAMSGNDAWTNGYNYWAIIRTWYHHPDDVVMENFGTIVHEVHHNMGFGHANTGQTDIVGYIHNFSYSNGYEDTGCFMGWGGPWYTVPNPAQFTYVIARGTLIQHWYRWFTYGEHVYRLLANDHPLSRLFLGTPEPAFNDTDKIQGIEYSHHAIGLHFNFTAKDFNSKIPSEFSYARIPLFYRADNYGLASYKNRGVGMTLGRVIKSGNDVVGLSSNLLNTMNDDLASWSFSNLPLGYVSMPEQDIGTLSFQVMRFHHPKNLIMDISLVEKPPLTATLAEVPYVEIQVKYLPGVPYVAPARSAALPEVDTAPTLGNCVRSEAGELACDLFSASHIWWMYIKGGKGTCREGNLPRWLAGNDLLDRGRGAMASYRGGEIANNPSFFCGRKDQTVVVKTTVKLVNRGRKMSSVFDYAACTVQRRPKTGTDADFAVYPEGSSAEKRWDVVLVHDLKLPASGASVVMTDMYQNERPVDLIGTGGLSLMEPYATQAYSDNMILVRNATHKLDGALFYRYRTAPTTRVAVTAFDDSTKTFEVVPADAPTKFSLPSILNAQHCVKNQWYYFIFTRTELSDLVMFDFSGVVPKNLVLYLETDNGIYRQRLWFLAGLSDISYRLEAWDVHAKTGGWSEIYRYMFSEEVTLESIRTLSINRYADFPDARPKNVFTETLGNYTFRLDCAGTAAKPEFAAFDVAFLKTKLHFSYYTDVLRVEAKNVKDPLGDGAPARCLSFCLLLITLTLSLL